MIKHFCDRCNTEIKRSDGRYEIRLIDTNDPIVGIEQELCRDCALKIMNYLDSQTKNILL